VRNCGDAIGTIRALLGDPTGQWISRGYILPLLNITYASVNLNLKNASAKELEAVVPIPNVPAGTTSLYPWQNATAVPGAPANANPTPALLAGLFDPIEIWIKPAGAPVSMYTRARERDTLPHVDPTQYATNSLAGGVFFNWLGNKLLITPVNQPLDMEVTGKFNPPPLVDDTDLLVTHEDVWVPTCFKTAAVAGVERSNPAILQGYAAESIAAQDNIIAELIRQRQATPVRFQRMSRAAGLAQWFWS
jgi:hypothetical protein